MFSCIILHRRFTLIPCKYLRIFVCIEEGREIEKGRGGCAAFRDTYLFITIESLGEMFVALYHVKCFISYVEKQCVKIGPSLRACVNRLNNCVM